MNCAGLQYKLNYSCAITESNQMVYQITKCVGLQYKLNYGSAITESKWAPIHIVLQPLHFAKKH